MCILEYCRASAQGQITKPITFSGKQIPAFGAVSMVSAKTFWSGRHLLREGPASQHMETPHIYETDLSSEKAGNEILGPKRRCTLYAYYPESRRMRRAEKR